MPRETLRCQSCGIPLDAGWYGTNVNGSINRDFCVLCYKLGVFTRPDVTADEMVSECIRRLTKQAGVPQFKAEEWAKTGIPNLKRWKDL